MNNELTLFPELNTQNGKGIHSLSCYQGLSEEAIDRLEGYVLDIHNIANRASFDLAMVLCKARDEYKHNKHGGFEGWIDQALGWDRKTAYNTIQRYEKFGTGEYIPQLDNIVLTAQYRLSAPSTPIEAREEALERAESGEKITVAKADELVKKWQRIAEEKEKEAKDAQSKLGIFQAHSQLAQAKVDELTQQITDLEEKIKTIQTPEKVEVIPQTTLDKIANLEALVKKLKEHSQNLSNENEKLVTDLRKQREANEARRKQEQYESEIKSNWKKSTEALYKALSQFVGSIPSPIAVQVFEGDEWARYDQIEQALKHFYEAFTSIKGTQYSNQFVESAIISVPAMVEG